MDRLRERESLLCDFLFEMLLFQMRKNPHSSWKSNEVRCKHMIADDIPLLVHSLRNQAKAKKALREKHEEQLSATRIRQEAERIVDRVQAGLTSIHLIFFLLVLGLGSGSGQADRLFVQMWQKKCYSVLICFSLWLSYEIAGARARS